MPPITPNSLQVAETLTQVADAVDGKAAAEAGLAGLGFTGGLHH